MIFSSFELLVASLIHSIIKIDPAFCENNLKIDFQDGRQGDHFGHGIRTIIAIFYLLVGMMPRIKVSSRLTKWFGRINSKIDFQDCHHGDHFGHWIGTILALFDQLVTLMLPWLKLYGN